MSILVFRTNGKEMLVVQYSITKPARSANIICCWEYQIRIPPPKGLEALRELELQKLEDLEELEELGELEELEK